MNQHHLSYSPATPVPFSPSTKLSDTSTEEAHPTGQQRLEVSGTTDGRTFQSKTARHFNWPQSVTGHAERFHQSHETETPAQDPESFSKKTPSSVRNALERKYTLSSIPATSFKALNYPSSHIRQSLPQGLSGGAPPRHEDSKPINIPKLPSGIASNRHPLVAAPGSYYANNPSASHALNPTRVPVSENESESWENPPFDHQRYYHGKAHRDDVFNPQSFVQPVTVHPTAHTGLAVHLNTDDIRQKQSSRASESLPKVDNQFVSSRHSNSSTVLRDMWNADSSAPMNSPSDSNPASDLAFSLGASRGRRQEDVISDQPLIVRSRPDSPLEAQLSGLEPPAKRKCTEDQLPPPKRYKTSETKVRRRKPGMTTAPAYQPTQRCPPPFKIEDGFWVCTYNLVGDIACGRKRRLKDKRGKHRHLSTHAANEEILIARNLLRRDEAIALEWVAKLRVTCRDPGCNYSIEVWRTDYIRAMHYAQSHD